MQHAHKHEAPAPSAFDALADLATLEGQALPILDANPEIFGRIQPAKVAPVRAPARDLASDEREAVVRRVLPALRHRSLVAVAGELGIAPSTLRAWCLALDGEAYEEALRAHIGAELDECATEFEAAARMARVGCSMTVKGRKIMTSDGDKATGYTLHGPAVVSAARGRASIALDRAKFWQFIGERRLPKTFGAKEDEPGKRTGRASFTFIVDGRKHQAGGRLVGSSTAARASEPEETSP